MMADRQDGRQLYIERETERDRERRKETERDDSERLSGFDFRQMEDGQTDGQRDICNSRVVFASEK